MKIFRSYLYIDMEYTPCILTIGNFDGVHIGHQALLANIRKKADENNLFVCVLLFLPHPKEFFSKTHVSMRIMTLRNQLEKLKECGVDIVIIQRFNYQIAYQSPENFIKEITQSKLKVQWMIVGDDFQYGAQRKGNFSSIQIAGHLYKFKSEKFQRIAIKNGPIVSSSRIRSLIVEGKLEQANTMLGYPYCITGHVIHGSKIGHILGFPTLNISLQHKNLLISGIFVVLVYGIDPKPLPSVASIGTRPTITNSHQVFLEVNVLNWHGNAYGKIVHVKFLKKLRKEHKFSKLEILQHMIKQDVDRAKNYFAG